MPSFLGNDKGLVSGLSENFVRLGSEVSILGRGNFLPVLSLPKVAISY